MRLRSALAILLTSVAAAEEPRIFESLDFETACAKAKVADRIVVVDFFTDWCGPCKKLDRTTWLDEKVVAWFGEKAIALKIDAEKETALAEKYRVDAYPTILLLKPDGTEIDRLVGYRTAEEFLKDAGDALEGRDSVSRAKARLVGDDANNPMLRGDYGDALARKGRYEEALKEYLWCYDHGIEFDRAYYGVRGSFLLSDITQLGSKYPPALQALRTRRDAIAELLLAGKGSVLDAGDLASLNKCLGESNATLELYDKLGKAKEARETRAALLDDVFGSLLEARRYDDLADGAAESVDNLFRRRKDAAAMAEEENSEALKSYAEFVKAELVAHGGGFYEAYLGRGQKDEAEALARRILEVSTAGKTWAALIRHAIRAGDADAARSLATRGLEVAPKKARKAIREAAAEIPEK